MDKTYTYSDYEDGVYGSGCGPIEVRGKEMNVSYDISRETIYTMTVKFDEETDITAEEFRHCLIDIEDPPLWKDRKELYVDFREI